MSDLDLGTYQDFAYFTASDESKNFDKFKNLSNKKGNIEKYLNHHSDNDILIVNNRLINVN